MMMKAVDTLSSLKLFFSLAALLSAAFAIGGLLPQGLSSRYYQEIFGRIGAAWIEKAGFNDVFASPWFLALMTGAALNLLACTVKQWKLVKPRPGMFLTHLAVILLFAGGTVRGLYGVSGTLAMETGETRAGFVGTNGAAEPLPFEVTLRNFRITYWEGERHFIHAVSGGGEVLESAEAREGGALKFSAVPVDIKILRFYPNFAIGPSGPFSAAGPGANPALAIASNSEKKPRPQYLFARHPDYHGVRARSGVRLIYEHRPGRIKQFESALAITEGGELKMEKTISVNSPASYRGYRFYQAGYDPDNPDFSSIQVSRDPGAGAIYAGFALLMAGLTLAFWKEMKE